MAALPEEIITQNKMAITSKDLPEEIITQILYRVPAKSVGRFRSVSKGWLSLLTHPDFIKTHRNALNKHHLIFSNIPGTALYSNSYDEPILKPSDFWSEPSDYIHGLTIHGSCNGLVLVGAHNDDFRDIFVLFNPSTKESMLLPEYYDDDSNVGAYEYFESDYMRGLGYDSETGDFKVVSLFCVHHIFPETPGLGIIYGHIYSLKTNTWRQLTTNSLNDYRPLYPKLEGVFVDGFLHWFATKSVNGLELTVILAFSLADEKFSEVTLPEFVESNEYMSSRYCRLVVLGGKLGLFHGLNGEIWLLSEYKIKESWTKILLHGIHGIPTVTPRPYNKPMVFCHDGKFMVANSDRMMVYDDEKETFEETVCVWDPANLVNGSYVECLVSIASCIEQ